MAISDAELAKLVKLTGAFENSGDPYLGVSGDFDGQGISCGVLQWNIGQGSLQKLVIGAGKPVVSSMMPTFGDDMWKACNSPLADGLKIVRSWQNNKTVKKVPKAELTGLMGSSAMKAQQDIFIRKVGVAADTASTAWAAARGTGARSIHELAWFFDVYTQNGSMAGLDYSNVKDFIQHASPGAADDIICDWLAGLSKKTAGYADAIENAKLWRNKLSGEPLDLLVLSYLRSQKSKIQWRADVLNRKGTIAARHGWVHKTEIDLSGIL